MSTQQTQQDENNIKDLTRKKQHNEMWQDENEGIGQKAWEDKNDMKDEVWKKRNRMSFKRCNKMKTKLQDKT